MSIESEDISRCLLDAHCGKELIERVCSCNEAAQKGEAKRLLFRERKRALDDIHCRQRDLDCIDHVLWHLDHEG